MLFGSGPKKALRKKCFCGSGNTFFFCHGQLIYLLRNKIAQIREKSANDYKIDSGKAMNELIGVVLEILHHYQYAGLFYGFVFFEFSDRHSF